MEINSYSDAEEYVKKLFEDFIKINTIELEMDLLNEKCNVEKRDIVGYHGREIFELLQNADDAYQKSINFGNKPEEPLEVYISFIDNLLEVRNTGTEFDKEGIKSIVQGNNSSKQGNLIGKKGTGFRSILNWVDEIQIHSGFFHVNFSKKIANDVLEQIKHIPQISKQLKTEPNLYIPMLSVPKYMKEYDEYKDSTTVIKLYVNKYALANDIFSIENQLVDLNLRILLFLPNIQKIIVKLKNDIIEYYREEKKDSHEVKLIKKSNGVRIIEEKFYVYKKICEISNKQIDLKIAIPDNLSSFSADCLYTYFPLMDTNSPFNFLLHATYDLTDQRNNIVHNEFNKSIIRKQLEFIVDLACDYLKDSKYDIAYNMLIPNNANKNWKFLKPIDQFNFEEYFCNLIYEKKLFLSVNGKLLSLKEGGKCIRLKNNIEYPDTFKNKEFLYLIKNDSEIMKLISLLEIYNNSFSRIFYNTEELCDIINSISFNWDIKSQVKTFIWWNLNMNFDNSPILPNLLKDNKNQWIKQNSECYLLEGNISSDDLPDWVERVTLHKDYQFELLKQSKNLDIFRNIKEYEFIRELCQNKTFKCVEFKYTDISNITLTMNKSVNNNYENSIDYVKWLWKKYNEIYGEREQEFTEWLPPKTDQDNDRKYNFPSDNKNVKKSNELFFGSNYGYNIVNKLCDDVYCMFPKISTFNIDENNKNNFINFISKFGVIKYPLLKDSKFSDIDRKYSAKYYEMVAKEINYKGQNINIKSTLKNINNLSDLLENKLNMEEIIKWIYDDNKLREHIEKKVEFRDIVYEYYYYSYRSGKIIYPVDNYILYIFNNSKWINIDNKKYSPKEVIYNISSRSSRVELYKKYVPTITDEYIRDIALKCSLNIDDIKEILNIFEFCKEVTDLKSNDFYAFLFKISESDNFEKLYRKLYSLIESLDKTIAFDDSENKKRFFNEGKLLVLKHNKPILDFAKESFVPSTNMVNKINKSIILKQARTNNEDFITIFGCNKYEKSFTLDLTNSIESCKNIVFKQYFDNFRKYIKPFSENNSNIKECYNDIDICLIKKLSIIDSEGGQVFIEDNYAFFRDDDNKNKWYITVFDDTYCLNKLSFVIGDIFNHIANSGGFKYERLAEIFRVKNNDDRKFLIENYFGTISVLDEEDYFVNDIKVNFENTLLKILPNFDIKNIDINFNHFDSDDSCGKIITLFKNIGIDIEDFKKAGFVYEIDLSKYYNKYLKKYMEECRKKNRFRNYLYTKALNDDNLKDIFAQTVSRFEIFDEYEFTNSVYIDFKSAIYSTFEHITEEDLYNINNYNIEFIDAEKVYRENYDKLRIDNRVIGYIDSDYKIKNIIYFNLEEKCREWERDKLNHYNNIHKIQQSVTEIFNNYTPLRKSIEHNQSNINNNINYKKEKLCCSIIEINENNRNNKIVGNIGEYLIYKKLCDEYGHENVTPSSDAFVELKIITPGQIKSMVYDIEYTDKNGILYYVEVKTISKHKSYFYMSAKELDFAKKYENYKLYIVYDINEIDLTYNYDILQDNFWEHLDISCENMKIRLK